MKRKNLKRGVTSLSFGVLLLALSFFSSHFMIGADGTDTIASGRVAISKAMIVVAIIAIAIGAYFFSKVFERSKY